jgi:TPR repeat protein
MIDHKEAVRWYRKAAAMGSRNAMYNAGMCFDTGMGVPVDTAAALGWYSKAAGLGHAEAKQRLLCGYG